MLDDLDLDQRTDAKYPPIHRFSPVAWQYINFIGKYEFYNIGDMLNIQWLIKNIVVSFEIDISSIRR